MRSALVLVPAFCLLLAVDGTATVEVAPQFILKWGSNGSAAGQFNYPISAAVDRGGNVYVADQGNHRSEERRVGKECRL